MTEESLFAAALERPTEAERRAFLDGACDGDVALRRRVERLLAAHEKTLGIVEQLIGPPGASEAAAGRDPGGAPTDERVGALVAGRYVLLEKIGEGGMGTVWKAEQTRPVRRAVALKLIRAGMDSRTVLARFDAERQALALMDHPNIAKVHDGGTTEGGRPFFVMEYVRGVPILQHCDDARLSIAERLALFVPVCRAVQHAHAKGIIHRDLKPGNILVCPYDGRPVPKVIDFGLAKATHRPLTEHTLHTAHGAMLGTPLYMSPEQAALDDLDVDTRTDVYALGVVLYELLTGTTPLERRRFREAAWDEVLRLIKEEEPPRPSARLGGSDSLPSLAAQRQLEPSRLTRMVRGELDWIVMKCLEKDRSRRYETADGLAQDVQRYLADESVEACPPSAGYRLGKLVRRNRGPVLAGSIIFLLLIGGIAGTTWGLIRAERAREQAQERLRQIEKGSEVLASVFRDLDPILEEKEGRPLRSILGDRLLRAAEQLEGEGIGDPLLVAGLRNRLGVSLLNLGLAQRAIPLLEQARAARAAVLGGDHPDTLVSRNNLASAYHGAGQRDRALRLDEETLELRRARLGPDHPDTLNSMHNLAVGYQSAGQWERAARLHEETLRLKRALLGPDHPKTLDTMNGLGVSLKAAGDLDRALPLLEEALELRRARQGPDHLDTLNTMNNLAEGYKAANRLDRALPLLEETLKSTRAKVGPDHPDTLTGMNNLAAGYRAANQLDRALPLYEEALKLRKARLGPDHADTLTSMNNLAEGYRAAGDLGRALPLLEETLGLMRAKLAPGHPHILGGMNNLAEGYRAAGDLGRALPLLEEALGLMRAKLAPGHPNTLIVMNNLASGYKAAGQLDRALPLFREAATGVEAKRFNHPRAGTILDNLIGSQEQSGRFDEAEDWRRKWLAAVKERAGAGSPEYAAQLSALGANLLQQGKWADAESVLREAVALREKRAPGAWETHQARSLLGGALLGRKEYAEAEPLLIRGYEGVKALEGQVPGPARGCVAEAGERVVRLYEAWGRPEKAAEWRTKRPGPGGAEPDP